MSLHNVYREPLPRHSHNMSERRYMDIPMGTLVPFYCHELYPGDKVYISSRALLETRTLSAPLKSNIRFREYWFFVPRRLMWKNWEKFIFGGKSGDYTAEPPYIEMWSETGGSTVPVNSMLTGVGSLWDYFGFPLVIGVSESSAHAAVSRYKVDAMPFVAYQMIFKDWFRDENFSDDSWDFENNGSAWLHDGGNNAIRGEDGLVIVHDFSVINGSNRLYALRHPQWSRTYFTAALPFRQRGTANRVPLSGTAFLNGYQVNNGSVVTRYGDDEMGRVNVNNARGGIMPSLMIGGVGDGYSFPDFTKTSDNIFRTKELDDSVQFGIEGSDLQGFTITELRLLAKLQQFAEINARFGFRYLEGLRGHFGVSPSDGRLDRPEFIGGMSQDVVVSEIMQTSETGNTPLGTPAGRGISAGGSRIGSYYAEEHGILMGICSIMPEQIYTQGIPREWTRRTKEEFFAPEFNGLSEQEIRTKEVYAAPGMTDDQLDTVFGFVPAWEELRHGKTMAVGNLRNPEAADLFSWTMARYFDSVPTLNSEFKYAYQYSDYGSHEHADMSTKGGIRTDAWTTGKLANPFFVSIASKVRKISTVSASGVPGITRI